VKLLGDAVPGVVIDRDGGEFDEEEDPLERPAKDKVVDERAGGLGLSKADSEPDANAADGAEDSSDDEKEARVALKLLHPVLAALAQRFALGHEEPEAPADGELGNHDMEDGDHADDPSATDERYFPKWIVHVGCVSRVSGCPSSRGRS